MSDVATTWLVDTTFGRAVVRRLCTIFGKVVLDYVRARLQVAMCLPSVLLEHWLYVLQTCRAQVAVTLFLLSSDLGLNIWTSSLVRVLHGCLTVSL